MYLNPNLFFLFKDGELVMWDYQNHQQFALEDAYFNRIKQWAKGNVTDSSPIDQELIEAKILSSTPYHQAGWGWDLLAHIFHVGTSDIAENTLSVEEWTKTYLEYCAEIAKTPLAPDSVKEEETIALPMADSALLNNASLVDVFYKRKTCRSFYGQPITLEQLSTFLYFSFGIIHKEWPDLEGLQQLGVRKAFPSGGGLHPEEAYIVVLNVDGLQPGIYHYHSQAHRLQLIEEGAFQQQLIDLLCSQYFAEGIAVGIFLTSRFEKSWWKYPHSRGYRVCLLDIGHASQTGLLTATALGLNTWISGAFSDSQTRSFLKLKRDSEFPIFFMGIGYGSNDSLNPALRKALEE